MDALIQPRIGSLYQGVSRQAPLLRAPNQFEDLVNYLPSVDLGGIEDRPGAVFLQSLPAVDYGPGPHHYFRTTDGQSWVLLRRAGSASFEVRNWDTGVLADLDIQNGVLGYLATGAGNYLRYLTVADTTLVLNPEVTVLAQQASTTPLTNAYIVVRRMSSATQAFFIKTTGGECTRNFGADNRDTRESVATGLLSELVLHPELGLAAALLANAPYIIKVTGTESVIASLSARNNWDESAVLLIKGRVTAASDLPPAFEAGVPIAVDLSKGDKSSTYYVRYAPDLNAWIETSYAANDAPTATLTGNTMPLRLRQTGANAFSLEQCAWVARTKGDQDSNPMPFFVGKRIKSMSTWKGRLALTSEDTAVLSQADDLFNWWKETARESRAADPIELPADAPGLAEVRHVVPFRNKLMVIADNAQLEVPGDQPLTPETATIGVATRYNLDKNCTPVVIGDSLYYTGISQNRAALWEYYYDDSAASNTAFDLSKHVPGFIVGKVNKIDGNAESGRVVVKTDTGASLYVHTSYWTDGRRAQNAWTRLTFPGLTSIQDFWVDSNEVRMVALGAGRLWRLALPLDTAPDSEARLDFQANATAVASPTAGYSRVPLPLGMQDLGAQIVFAVSRGAGWLNEYTGTVTVPVDGVRYLEIASDLVGLEGVLGVRYERSFTFSPFYPSIGDSPTPVGRLQVRQVILDLLRGGDLRATVTRADRAPALTALRSPRVLGVNATQPIEGHDFQVALPFNARGNAATLTVVATSTVPTVVTGYTLMARYTNQFTEK